MTAPAPLLEVRGLAVEFRSGDGRIRAVDDVDLALDGGEVLALVGESGCGKSTLARAVVGLVPTLAGSVRLSGAELVGASRRDVRAMRARIQMVFQDPDASLNPRMTAAALIGEPLRLHAGLRGDARERRVAELMERVGLDAGLRGRYPHAFSGGQRQRIAIARALAVEPALLVCDEVTSALDVSIQAQILNLLRDLQRDLGIALLFISHDLAVVRQISQRMAVMYLGQIVESRSTRALFERPAHPYTRALLAAVPRIEGPGARSEASPGPRLRGELPSPTAPPSGCRFHPRCPEAFARCDREAPRPVSLPDGAGRCFLLEDGA